MDPALIRRILHAYGIEQMRLMTPQKGYRNNSHPLEFSNGLRLNLIIYKAETGILERIKRTNQISNYLASSGLAARRQQGPILQLNDKLGTRYAALYDYLAGETIPWEAYTKRHIKLLGKTMSDMHGSIAAATIELPDAIAESHELIDTIRLYTSTPGVQKALSQKLKLAVNHEIFVALHKLLLTCEKLSQRQPLHMDFVRGNILFSQVPTRQALCLGSTEAPPYISGILDMEKAAKGPPVFDVARTLAFLLVDCKYKPAHKVTKYFIESGYQKRGASRLDKRQLAVLRGLTRLYMLHDFYKFLLHNPYEFLPQNEHFVRTRDFLLKDGIIKPTR